MSSTKKTNVNSGWYRDPNSVGILRYWDGEGWTNRRMLVDDSHQISVYALLALIIPLAFWVAAPVAFFLGLKGLHEIDASNGHKTGRGMAITGIVLSLVVTLLMVIAAFVFVANLNG